MIIFEANCHLKQTGKPKMFTFTPKWGLVLQSSLSCSVMLRLRTTKRFKKTKKKRLQQFRKKKNKVFLVMVFEPKVLPKKTDQSHNHNQFSSVTLFLWVCDLCLSFSLCHLTLSSINCRNHNHDSGWNGKCSAGLWSRWPVKLFFFLQLSWRNLWSLWRITLLQ